MLRLSPISLVRARELRLNQTKPEVLMWLILRDRRFQNFKFRRQQPMGPYILDFFCPKARLAIELDGGGHDDILQRNHDERRSQFLKASGIRVLRFWNNQIFQEKEGVLKVIYDALRQAN